MDCFLELIKYCEIAKRIFLEDVKKIEDKAESSHKNNKSYVKDLGATSTFNMFNVSVCHSA